MHITTIRLVAAILVFGIGSSVWAQGVGPVPVLIWPGGTAPGATGTSDEDKPAIYPFLPDSDKNTGAAMLVIPGGGFMTRVTDQEGVLVAQWFKSRGIAAFMLRYRLRPIGNLPESVANAHRAIQFIRANAEQYKISPDRIGMIGFSAGAELQAAASYKPPTGNPESQDPVERQSAKANFEVLVYGAAARAPNDNDNTGSVANFPPTFMFCTVEDASHFNPMMTLYQALIRARVPVDAHFFYNGGHGVGLAQGDPVLGVWPDLMYNWMRASGFLTSKPRVGVTGMAMLDGQPLPRGAVTFHPIDQPGAMPVTAYVFNTNPVRGEFVIPQAQGLVPGKYRVEMYQYAGRWMSNARESFIVEIQQKQRQGLTEQDRQAWAEFVRKRDLSPTLEDLRVFRKKRPSDPADMTVEIKAGEENKPMIEVLSK